MEKDNPAIIEYNKAGAPLTPQVSWETVVGELVILPKSALPEENQLPPKKT